MRRAVTMMVACLICAAAAAAPFKRLSASDIERTLMQRIITDDAHWSDRFDPDGKLQAVALGKAKNGTWRVSGNELCTVRNPRKPEEECFEVWVNHDEIELRRDGIAIISAFLRPRQ